MKLKRSFKKIDFKAVDRKSKKVETATARHAHKFLVSRLENLRHIRRHLTGWFVLLIILISLTALQIVFNQNYLSVEEPASDKAYAEGVLGPVNNINPLFASSDAELSADRLMFLSLLRYDTQGKLQGDAALDYQINDNGKTYVVDLKSDLKWQDGKPLTSEDVVYTVTTMQNPATGAKQFSGWQNVKVSANGPYQVVFTLPTSYAPFASALTFSILPSHLLSKIPAEDLQESKVNDKLVGSGPFKLVDTQIIDTSKGTKALHFDRNDNYWGGKPQLSKFSLYVYDTRDNMAKALSHREINAASGLGAKLQNIHTLDLPINNGVFTIFRIDNEILKDKAVRKALVQATDRSKLRQQLGGKNALEGPIINSQTPVASQVRQAAYDEKAANQALDTSGWVKGSDGIRTKNSQPLEIRLVAVDTQNYRNITKLLAQQWKKVGIKAIPQLIDPEQIQQTILRPRAYDVLVYELSMGGDPDGYAFWHSSQATTSGLNFANYTSPAADDALVTARGRALNTVRDSKYANFARKWVEDVPAMSLYRSSLLYSTTEGTKSLQPSDLLVGPTDRYYNVSNWSAETHQTYSTP